MYYTITVLVEVQYDYSTARVLYSVKSEKSEKVKKVEK